MGRRYVVVLILLGALTLLSLLVSGVVLVQFLRLRSTARGIVADTRGLVADLADETFSYTVEVDQDIPLSTDVPFHEAVTVPINTVIPISTTVVVPINLRFTTYNLAVPIDTVVPVDVEVTVPFSETVSITTAVPVDVDVPLEIAVADTPLVGYLQELNAMLKETEEQLGYPVKRE